MRKKHLDMESIKIDGRKYVSHGSWCFGDYGGAGSVGLANIRVLTDECEGRIVSCGSDTLQHISEGCPYGLGADTLEEIRAERPWMISAGGSYGGEQVWIRKPLAIRCRDWLESVQEYSALSDDEVSRVEMEWEEEAWESWIRSDLIRTLPDDGSQEEAEMMPWETLFEAYRQAMEETNTYAEPEYSGVAVDVDRIAAVWAELVSEAIADMYTPN